MKSNKRNGIRLLNRPKKLIGSQDPVGQPTGNDSFLDAVKASTHHCKEVSLTGGYIST